MWLTGLRIRSWLWRRIDDVDAAAERDFDNDDDDEVNEDEAAYDLSMGTWVTNMINKIQLIIMIPWWFRWTQLWFRWLCCCWSLRRCLLIGIVVVVVGVVIGFILLRSETESVNCNHGMVDTLSLSLLSLMIGHQLWYDLYKYNSKSSDKKHDRLNRVNDPWSDQVQWLLTGNGFWMTVIGRLLFACWSLNRRESNLNQ